ncbi:MBL fold metallo-hydrolase [Undibacterium sp. CY18W]|uniref:MBL fold metallo-hydrolase n=1 Tax=Undibacterium hunanense TaxID=2762292 RepID=A0ABR6ZXY9_9BURK|nr:MBL fold metallo-hydrolase [Undibacterium hunanense]
MQLKSLLRSGLFSTSILAGVAVFGIPAISAHAAASMAKTSAPGFYRSMLGDFEITVLSDGTVPLPVDKLLTNTTPEKVGKALAKYHQQSPLVTSFNAFLINTGSKLILIDSGAGVFFGPTVGKLQANLKASGYLPEQIDEIYITHMHADHIGGLVDGDKAVYPNAIVRIDQHDTDFWLSQENLDKAKADAKGSFEKSIAILKPYVQAGKLKPFEGNTELAPGIKAVAAHGHTPGHTTYKIESKGQTLMLWGDLMHVAAVQFDNPAVTIQFDSDSKAAYAQRQKAYADAAQQGYLVGAAHLAFPALGYVRKEGKGYAWTPLNYAPLP